MLENINLLFYGFEQVFTISNVLAALIGSMIGLFVGAMPGLGALTGISVLLPLTFGLNPTTGIILLASLYYSTMYGGSFTAILINIPGDTPAVMTAVDGYPLTKKGYPGKALATSIFACFFGGSVGILILTVAGPLLAKVGLTLGSPELALLILLAMTSIGWIMGDDIASGLLGTAIGLMFSTIGVDMASGLNRFTFKIPNLLSGVSFVPLVIGVFGFAQVINMIVEPDQDRKTDVKLSIKDMTLTKQEFLTILPIALRNGLLGTFVGVLPGAGGTSAAFISYIFEKRINKNGHLMGTGVIEGIAAPESANNAAAAGAFAPMLTLGIPGSGTTALLLGGLMMWGLQPGPLLFTDKPEFVWPLISSFYLGNVICIIISFACIPLLMRAVAVPNAIMAPIIFAVCVVAAYTTNNSMFDVYFMIGVGVFSYFLKKAKIPTAPLLLAFVLSPMLEKYVRQSFDMSRGNPSIFFRNWICWMFIVLFLLFCIAPAIKSAINKKKVHQAT